MNEQGGDVSSSDVAQMEQKIRSAAIGLLARREHSVGELRQKAGKRFPESIDLLDDVFLRLSADGLQCDRRFAAAYIRMRHERGYGPSRIGQELLQRGVASDVVGECIAEAELDWSLLAINVMRKKFPQGAVGYLQKSKGQRFLYYRGFERDHINAALR